MKYFAKEEIMDLVTAIDQQDSWDTEEMQHLIEAAVKESDEQLNPDQYDDPDRLYEDCLKVFGLQRKTC